MTDSILQDLASLPSVRSLKIAQTIISEMEARGWRFVPDSAAIREVALNAQLKALSTPSHDMTRAEER